MNQIEKKIIEVKDESFTILDLFLLIARNIKLTLYTSATFILISVFYIFFLSKPQYISVSKIMSSNGVNQSSIQGFASQLGFDFSKVGSETQWVYRDIIKSRTIAHELIKNRYDSDKYGPQKSLSRILGLKNDNNELSLNELKILTVDAFLSLVRVSEDLKTGIFTITVKAEEPLLAYHLNKDLIKQVDIHQKNYNRTQTNEARKFIEERISATEKELNHAEEKSKLFKEQNRRIEKSFDLQLENRRLDREVLVLTQIFTTLKQQLETTKIEEVKDSKYVLVLDPPEIPIRKSGPNKRFLLLTSAIAGIFVSLFIIYLRSYKSNLSDEEKNKLSIIFEYLTIKKRTI